MITLRGLTWDHPRGYQPLIATAAQYALEFDVKIEWHKRSLKAFGLTPIDRLASAYDILIIDHPHVGLAARSSCLVPFDEYVDTTVMQTLAEQSAGASHASYRYVDHQWALAVDAAMHTSVYRPDLLGGPTPETWQDVFQLRDTLRQRGKYIALTMVPLSSICSFLTLCANLGDTPGHQDGSLVDNDIGRHALEILKQLVELAHPRSMTWNTIQMLDYMSQADDVVYCPLVFCYTNYARNGYSKYQLKFSDIPGVKGALLGGAGFAVSSHCAYPEIACAHGAWLCSTEIQRTQYVINGGQPGNMVAWQDAQANQITNDFFLGIMETLRHSYLRPRHDGFIAFTEKAGEIIHAFLRERIQLETCLSDIRRLYLTESRNS
jgi:multiple sugar transport system substrate-binding protein